MLAVSAVRGVSVITDDAVQDVLNAGRWPPFGLDYTTHLQERPREVAARLLATIGMTVAEMEAE